MGRLTRAVEATWTRGDAGGLGLALRALAAPYGAAMAIRNRAFDRGWLPARRVPARVVSVGNLVVGGSGKTPLALWLAERLAAAGRRPAIVARGYRKQRRGVVVVGRDGCPLVGAAEGGDEAVLMARRFRGPVVVGEDRVAAAQAAIARFDADTIVLDDGFQHRRLARDVDVVVTGDALAGARLLPAGPLREPVRSLARADAVVTTTGPAPAAATCPVFRARLGPEAVVRVEGDVWIVEPLATLAGRRVVAVAGIARPERFLADVARAGGHVVGRVLRPDHHAWRPAEVADVLAAAGDALVVTTEKDLVKWELQAGAPVRALRVGVEVDDAAGLVRLAGGTGMLCEERGGRRRPGGDRMAIAKEFLDVLACPKCHGKVVPTDAQDALVCHACRLRYRIEDDIPIMLVDEATPLD